MKEQMVRGTFMQIPYWKLRARFRACGYRDQEAAAAIGMSVSALSGRLNGHSQWKADEIEALCEVLEIEPDEIGELFFPGVRVCERSAAMKAPVGLLSDRTVLRQQDGGALPQTSSEQKKSLPVQRTPEGSG